jgi:hypothetical protein
MKRIAWTILASAILTIAGPSASFAHDGHDHGGGSGSRGGIGRDRGHDDHARDAGHDREHRGRGDSFGFGFGPGGFGFGFERGGFGFRFERDDDPCGCSPSGSGYGRSSYRPY